MNRARVGVIVVGYVLLVQVAESWLSMNLLSRHG